MLPLSYTYSRNIASLSSGPARYFKGPFKYLNDSQIPTLFYTLAHEITTLFCNSTLKKVPFSGTFHSPPPPCPSEESLSVGIDSVYFYHPKHATKSFLHVVRNYSIRMRRRVIPPALFSPLLKQINVCHFVNCFIYLFIYLSSATASELDIQLQALLKDLVMTQPEVVIPEVQLHCKELMVNFNR